MDQTRLFILILFTLCSDHTVIGIQLSRLQLPTLVRLGSPARLSCDFSLEQGESLYSVKWYKNSMEFFRYIASAGSGAMGARGEQREFTVYPQIGVYLDQRQSNTTHVYLRRSDLNTEGTYGCEVSTSTFSTVISEKELKVFAPPRVMVRIAVEQNEHNLSISCQTGPSKPPSLLYLLLNGQPLKVPALNLLQRSHLQLNRRSDGLVSSRLNVHLNQLQINQLIQLMHSDEYQIYYERLIHQLRLDGNFLNEDISSNSNTMTTDLMPNLKLDQVRNRRWSGKGLSSIISIKNAVNANQNEVTWSGPMQLQCAASIAQPLITSYAELHLQPESGWLPAELPSEPQLLVYDPYPSPSIHSNQPRWQQRRQVLLLNCTVPVIERGQPKPLLRWYINDREARDDEMLFFDQPELYEDELREFAYTNRAYSISAWNERMQLLEQTLRTVTVGLRMQLEKEHFQNSDGLRFRCTCTYASLIQTELQGVRLQSNGQANFLLFSSGSFGQTSNFRSILIVLSAYVVHLVCTTTLLKIS